MKVIYVNIPKLLSQGSMALLLFLICMQFFKTRECIWWSYSVFRLDSAVIIFVVWLLGVCLQKT